MLGKEIIGKLFPGELPGSDEIMGRYPQRELVEGAMVTRFAPSPTGFMHIGGVYTAMICERLAHQSGGIFYVRIEDTDKKREIEGAAGLIFSALERYGIKVDEGYAVSGEELGKYGPYTQSERWDIYGAFVKSLVEEGKAYPCFCSQEELEEMHGLQEAQEARPGYYGEWAKWRDCSEEEVEQALCEGKKFVIRLRSEGNIEKKIYAKDLLLGDREFFENDQDIVIMKSDGLPTYHMAHIVDDHLMGTTHVIRGNEWLSSLPLHLQMFRMMGWQAPRYGHIFPIQKMEGASRRKLSKRKDPEADVAFYDQQGYPESAIIEYLLNLANSNFEDWRKANLDKDNREFVITFKKLSSSAGPLFDFGKLDNISRGVIARYSAEEVYDKALVWAKKHDAEVAAFLESDPVYAKKIIGIERGAGKARKDIGKWSDVRKEIEYFERGFRVSENDAALALGDIKKEDIEAIVGMFVETYDEGDSSQEWFEKLKKIALTCGYADSAKAFQESPDKYKGSVADVARIFRVLLTGRIQTPDLCSIMQVMGKEQVFARLEPFRK